MVITRNNKINKEKRKLDDKTIEHNESVKILGTIFNDTLTWAHHIERGKQSLIAQLKQRRNAVIYILKKVSAKFALKYANSILISKLNYHIEIWGLCSKTQLSKIDKILVDTASIITNLKYGRTDIFIMKEIKWKFTNERYEDSIIKITRKILNQDTSNKHYLYSRLTKNRTLRMRTENKCNPKPRIQPQDLWSLKFFRIKIVDIYNTLPRQLTLIMKHLKFKKWLKSYRNNPENTKPPIYPDNVCEDILTDIQLNQCSCL